MPRPTDGDDKLGRRSFLESLGLMAGAAALGGGLTGCSNASGQSAVFNQTARAAASINLRKAIADQAFDRGSMPQTPNSDEQLYPNFIGNYSKGLPHNALGEVDPASYRTFRDALDNQTFDDLETLNVGPRKLENPQCGVSFALQGADVASIAMPAAPTFASAEEAGEMVELYWMALLRDINFDDYGTNADVAAAVAELNGLSDFRGPRSGGMVTSDTLFRSPTPGDLNGPYISQLLFHDVPYGTLTINQRQTTFQPGIDHMTTFNEWLAIQEGQQPSVSSAVDPTSRYIRNLRDLAAYVQKDVVYQAYLNAALILLGAGAPLKPEVNFYANSTSQAGFINYGPPMLITLLGEASALALRAVWFQKWFIHRRLRPEAFGGRIHVEMSSQPGYPIHPDVMNSTAVSRTLSNYGTSFLPMAFPEGSPRHPAYGAGHNTVAASCASLLKAFFDESAPYPNPMVPSADGLSLVPYTGPQLTVGGEIDKLAGNIAQGRNAAGVHWRTDYTGSMPLGEAVTETILAEQVRLFPEDGRFTYTRVDQSIADITKPQV